jgi:hypothetical protein
MRDLDFSCGGLLPLIASPSRRRRLATTAAMSG